MERLHAHWRRLALGDAPVPLSAVLCHCEDALEFIAVLQAWHTSPLKPKALHLIGVLLQSQTSQTGPQPDKGSMVAQLLDALAHDVCIPGFEPRQARPFVEALLGGNTQALVPLHTKDPALTLWLSTQPLSTLLPSQTLALDALLWPDTQDPYGPRLWARAVSTEALLLLHPKAPPLPAGSLTQAGFVNHHAPDAWHFRPRWSPKARISTSHALVHQAAGPRHRAIVVGAGLAGACSAWMLAQRGWQVTVLDEAAHMAQGASQLPAGLFCPVMAPNSPLSDLSQLGIWATVQLCQALGPYGLRQGQDYAFTGVRQTIKPGGDAGPQERWHPLAGWIKPARVVQTCLSHPSIEWQGHSQVSALSPEPRPAGSGGLKTSSAQADAPSTWRVELSQAGQDQVFNADVVILANACGATELVLRSAARSAPDLVWMKPPVLSAVAGQMNYGTHDATDPLSQWPAFPVNGAGHVMGGIPLAAYEGAPPQPVWMVGASYHLAPPVAIETQADTRANLAKAAALLPELAEFFERTSTLEGAKAWRGTRCVSPDRLPLVGAWPISSPSGPEGAANTALSPLCLLGLGSRGLSLAPLCAHWLAASLHQEPLPLPKRLAKVLSPARYI